VVDALFIDPKGIYPQLLGPEHCWDEKRDARTYGGPGPVVAHPPCQLWVNMAAVNWKRYGRQRPAWQGGSDGGCFAAALAAVRKYGGVLEHPAGSHAWEAHGLRKPPVMGWEVHSDDPGSCSPLQLYYVCEVWQHAYGHGARKRTYLLYCGVQPPFELNWERNSETVTHHCGHDAKWRTTKKRLEKRHASATPVLFAMELIALAQHAAGETAP
jgi:hypothetical protein